jgi:hypothetical protein
MPGYYAYLIGVDGHMAKRAGIVCDDAGLKKLLGPAVIHRSGDAHAAAKLRDALFAAQSL